MAPADIDEVPVQERRNNVEEQSEGIRLQTQRSAPHSGRSRGSFVSRRTSALTSKLRRNRKAIVMGVVGVAAVLAALYVARRWWTQKPREPGDSPPPEEPGDSPPRAGKPKAPSQPPTERRDVPTGVRQVGARDLPAPPASHTALLACLENRQIEFFGPSNSPHGFTPLYDPEPQKRVAMVDAGTNALFIGGAGVNGEVARLLTEEARRHEVRLTPEQLSEHSKRVQEDLLRLAVQHPRTLIELDTGARSPVFARSYGFVSVVPGTGWDESQTGRNVGATFIHILKDEVTPYGDPKNNAMVYTVAPSGNAPDASYSQAFVCRVVLWNHSRQASLFELRARESTPCRIERKGGEVRIGRRVVLWRRGAWRFLLGPLRVCQYT
ncbi:hypothetical protein NCLIV_004730 [Neospora caninum Liverpool]|uniref:Transmembrane protein n=1 Tax=Neospora caninum (strain Liverpool) TaxID=572307 RepID=F0V8F5_NEOCL|nr:hypothetical protein NCLIV_004730 [Neospora caninum Liverpool]CBZ49996.1 hypothetical protein NCLIV_004730 [Neospora caninum Liverpool]|eukprot:XP_003880031.1 hypothetical protein NCLIV_004730 [Neospora caninum Liverpool]